MPDIITWRMTVDSLVWCCYRGIFPFLGSKAVSCERDFCTAFKDENLLTTNLTPERSIASIYKTNAQTNLHQAD